MMKRLPTFLLALFVAGISFAQKQNSNVRTLINNYFTQYKCDIDLSKVRVEKVNIDLKNKLLDIHLNQNFSYQLFRTEVVDSVYCQVQRLLPKEYSDYEVAIFSNDRDIRNLVPNYKRSPIDQTLLWNNTAYSGLPWTSNSSKPYSVKKGLSNIHLSVTPSHGYYYSPADTMWKWQRPPLFCTREDLLSQSFVYPYLIPMLENAGAVVYTPRERDWQTNCVIIDNTSKKTHYQEEDKKKNSWYTVEGAGFLQDSSRICRENSQATVRVVKTDGGETSKRASCMWIPYFPQDGDYAVYVTYQTYKNSSNSARYIVFHSGGTTTFKVNQKIGGGTWVYLGTFPFKKGKSASGMVSLDNSSLQDGVICADAVRFGGGIGNEKRGAEQSMMPRYLEGARYYTKFAGAPDSIFLKYQGIDDYREDIQARPRMTNWVSGGSVFNPTEKGISVPIELSFALHTDAGYRDNDSIIGSLGIYTTRHKDGLLSSGLSRDVSRDLADMVLSNVKQDYETLTGRKWTERGLWDKDYCESREPQVPSMILELLSHQNFYDMKYAMDPNFRFFASRSIYKSILQYVNFMHGRQYVVQPLPVSHFMIKEDINKKSLHLSWKPETDCTDHTAQAESFVIYTAIDDDGFDNGRHITNPNYDFSPLPGHVYRFKVTAVNAGGESFPSETLSACISKTNAPFILVANCFQRLGGPATISTDSTLGFDIITDPGVQYIKSPIFCGVQQNFNKKDIGKEEELSLGYSGNEYNGQVLAGNSFDYPYIHGMSIASSDHYSFVSCSREAIEDGQVKLSDYVMIDLIMGLQKRTDSDTLFHHNYATFSETLQKEITLYLNKGGRLLTTGSYIGSDMSGSVSDVSFTKNVLKYQWSGSLNNLDEDEVIGLKSNIEFRRISDTNNYGVIHPDIIEPIESAIPMMAYGKNSYCAGVAYNGKDYKCITIGIPFESIIDKDIRDKAMNAFIKYLVE